VNFSENQIYEQKYQAQEKDMENVVKYEYSLLQE